jgi:hypothetical protein
MKICFKCGAEKNLSEFYKHKGMADGHLNKCKECTRLDVKERAESPEMIEIIREEKRLWARTARGSETLKNYSSSLQGKEKQRLAKKLWNINNKKKVECNRMVNNAVRSGFLKKPKQCQVCSAEPKRIHGHHCDYSKPLDVIWMCPSCHAEWHRKNEPINGE